MTALVDAICARRLSTPEQIYTALWRSGKPYPETTVHSLYAYNNSLFDDIISLLRRRNSLFDILGKFPAKPLYSHCIFRCNVSEMPLFLKISLYFPVYQGK